MSGGVTKGSVQVSRPRPGVMCTVIRGYCDDAEAAVHMSEARTSYARGERLHHFFDVEDLTNYASSARVALTRFAIENRAHVASATFLVRSKIVAMGVSTAALAARLVGLDFVVLHRRADFEQRLKSV